MAAHSPRAPVTRRLRAAGGQRRRGIVRRPRLRPVPLMMQARVEMAEDHAGRIGGAIEAALADNRLCARRRGGTVRIEVGDIRLLGGRHARRLPLVCPGQLAGAGIPIAGVVASAPDADRSRHPGPVSPATPQEFI